MITLTIEIEGSQYEGVFRLNPGFDARTATDQECDLFMDLLERLAPGIDFDDTIDDQMEYLTEALCGAHDDQGEPEEGDPTTEILS